MRTECPYCSETIEAEAVKCRYCGESLGGGETRKPEVTGDATGGLIPYKNASALIAYYLAVFSLLPCVGSVLGLAALFLGIRGLRHATRHPEARGQVHAWIGIVAGGLLGLFWTVVVLFGLGSAAMR